jgi:hypothetical protein
MEQSTLLAIIEDKSKAKVHKRHQDKENDNFKRKAWVHTEWLNASWAWIYP